MIKKVIFLIFLVYSSLGFSSTYIRSPALIQGVTSTATAGTTTTLTAANETNQVFTGTLNQTVVLPDTTTLDVGRQFYITNRSTGTVTVNFNGGSLARTLIADTQAAFIVRANGTAAGTWDVSRIKIDVSDASSVTGVLPIANGGTNKALTLSAGGLPWFDADSFEVLAAGSAGNIPLSGGATTPTWLSNGAANTFLGSTAGAPGNRAFQPPVSQVFTSGTGTYNASFIYIITSGSATAAATYTNNGNTYTVVTTVASATSVIMTGTALPTSSGTLTKATGTGDATLTFSTYYPPLWLEVMLVGSGGTGSGSGTAGGGNGTAGNSSTWNTAGGGALITGAGGALAAYQGTGPLGGACTISATLTTVRALRGGSGEGYSAGTGAGSVTFLAGGYGGAGGLFGFTQKTATGNTNGANSTVNTGNGGQGGGQGGGTGLNFAGTGGGGGGGCHAIIRSPALTYDWTVGAAQTTVGTAGTAGFDAGQSGSGKVVVIEHYN